MLDRLLCTLALTCLASVGLAAGAPAFVGSETCRACHQPEFDAWQGSHHQQAMQAANEVTMLGNFDQTEFTYNGVTSRFFRDNDRFMVRTENAAGDLQNFEISYTFGVYPLQQYLLVMPDGRYQALGIAWDSRPAEEGGQRWFHLYPGEQVDHKDELHWTGAQQNWNFMCADCHSTNLRKGYAAGSDTFRTTWSEISVGCEACHGPGSQHAAWARLPAAEREPGENKGLSFLLNERSGVRWAMDSDTGNAQRSAPNTTRREIEVCASCHSRRGIIREGAAREASFLDHYLPALLTEGLYHADGQIRDEVYVWGSFLQSRMYAAGVTCSDCHDPHSQQLRAPGDAVCAQCHAPARFAATEHHHHPEDSLGARCANCHMPETTYMVVDPRRDHSMRIPRPDLSARFGTPNACTQCHGDRDSAWASRHFADWYPDPRPAFQSWTAAFFAARHGQPGAGRELAELITDTAVPDIARATAVLELQAYLDPQTAQALQGALRDDSPLVRLAALRVMDAFPVESALPFSAHLLQDDLLAVRTEAARILAGASRTQMNQGGADLLDQIVKEYIATQELHADRAESLMNLGNLYVSLDEPARAERYFRAVLTVDEDFVPGWINLADLYRRQGLNQQAVQTLRQGIEAQPEAAALHHSLGLALVRQGNQAAALEPLARATRLAPDNARFAYVQGVALNSAGRSEDAITVLEANHGRHPTDRDTLFALATIHRDRGQVDAARRWADRLLSLNPADPGAQRLRESLGPN
jgi:predicted CXXCH cytochrome family protein